MLWARWLRQSYECRCHQGVNLFCLPVACLLSPGLARPSLRLARLMPFACLPSCFDLFCSAQVCLALLGLARWLTRVRSASFRLNFALFRSAKICLASLTLGTTLCSWLSSLQACWLTSLPACSACSARVALLPSWLRFGFPGFGRGLAWFACSCWLVNCLACLVACSAWSLLLLAEWVSR